MALLMLAAVCVDSSIGIDSRYIDSTTPPVQSAGHVHSSSCTSFTSAWNHDQHDAHDAQHHHTSEQHASQKRTHPRRVRDGKH
jgi:hypothetical protein